MDFTYESQGTNTYLVYEIKNDDEIDSMSLGMLTNNRIDGFALASFAQMDTKRYIKYNVSAKVSVRNFFNGAVNKKRLIGVFEGIVDGLLSAEDYMIDPRTIVLDLDYIFADVSTCEASLVCLPVSGSGQNITDLSMFFKNIMFSTQFDQTENCDHVAKIINFLNGSPIVSLTDFKALLEDIKKDVQSVKTLSQTQAPQQKVPARETNPANTPVVNPASVKTLPPMKTSPTSPPKSNNTLPVQPENNVRPDVQSDTGKKIGMLDLLMHYSKENVELYKAQKVTKKDASQNETLKQSETKQQIKAGGAPNFAIPGQAASSPSIVPQSAIQPKVTQTSQVQQKPTANITVHQPAYIPREVPQGQAINFGETTVLGGGATGETTVLTATQNPAQIIAPHLIRVKNSEKISLNKPVFRIGKERSYVDYFIGDNTAISRSHANIIIREGEYFVVDTNSTNHTYVNGTMLQSNVETQIGHGDTIRLANEDFEFRLY